MIITTKLLERSTEHSQGDMTKKTNRSHANAYINAPVN
jgi:hypothetical protein